MVGWSILCEHHRRQALSTRSGEQQSRSRQISYQYPFPLPGHHERIGDNTFQIRHSHEKWRGRGAIPNAPRARPRRQDHQQGARHKRRRRRSCYAVEKTLAVSSAVRLYSKVPREVRRGSLIGKAVVLKTTARKRLQVRVLSSPPFHFPVQKISI